MNKLATLEPQIKLSIVSVADDGEKVVFGPGVAALCRGVRDFGSLNAAAKSMRMAYSKAWRIMGETEEALGMPLIIRDGARGSMLTDDGAALLDAYDGLQADLHRHAALKYAEVIAG